MSDGQRAAIMSQAGREQYTFVEVAGSLPAISDEIATSG